MKSENIFCEIVAILSRENEFNDQAMQLCVF